MKISFILTGEGSSDLRLVDHIENILIEEGFREVSGEAPDLGMFRKTVGHSVRDKLSVLVKHYPSVDVIFVHRDADNVGKDGREREIFTASQGLIDAGRIIPVIPVTMLETWLLTDHEAIKRVAGNKGYKGLLPGIPPTRQLERTRDTKELLLNALCEASQTTGLRLRRFKCRFSEMRTRLTFDLDANGAVNDLDSYKSFREKLRVFAHKKLETVNA